MGLVVFWLECVFLPLCAESETERIGGVALAPRGLGGWVARILLKCFFAGLGCGVLTPSRLKPYSPYMLTHTGGEKYSEFSDSGAAAIC